jgi:hypothetical protein
MSDIRVVDWKGFPDGQDQHKATGVDKHGDFHDFYAATEEEAYNGCKEEIEEAEEDEEDDE